MSTTGQVTSTAEFAVRSMLTIARMPATPDDDRKWCETMLDYMEQQYKAGRDDAIRAKGGAQFAEQAKLTALVNACKGLLAIIHDDLTHERQRDHAEAIDAARAVIGGGG